MLTAIIYLTLWMAMGLICMNMAKSRGRSGTLGFVLGLLFGIFAVLGYFLIGRTKEKEKELIREAIEEKNNK